MMTATLTCLWNMPKPTPTDVLMKISVANRGPEAAPLQVLPTLWFRNTWSWLDSGSKPLPRLPMVRIARLSMPISPIPC
jgi:hypothetical protein